MQETCVTKIVSLVLHSDFEIMEVNNEIKARIQSKAEDLFMRYGIRSVSMDDIATQLGMSKKTLYQYFEDKNKLVDVIVAAQLKTGECECSLSFQKSRDAIEEIFFTMEHIAHQFSNMNPVVLYDLEKFHPTSFEKFMKHKNEFLFEAVRKNLERGKAEGLYRPEVNTDIIARLRLESIMIAFNISVFPPTVYHLVRVTQEILDHYLYGLATLKGHKLILKYNEQRKKTNQ